MATAYTPNEAREIIGKIFFQQSDANRGTSLQLGLMTNTSGIGNTTVLGDITEPTGGSYARITLADASWSVSAAGVCTYAKQTFTATGSPYSANITGFFICTTGTAPKLVNVQVETSSTAVGTGEAYSVTPTINITG